MATSYTSAIIKIITGMMAVIIYLLIIGSFEEFLSTLSIRVISIIDKIYIKH